MRIRLVAPEGWVYTDGETYGTDITLAEGMFSDKFRLITREEYEAILEKQREEMMPR